jgi:hypothetical protein
MLPVSTTATNDSRPDAAQRAEIYTRIFPEYVLLIESYTKARDVERKHEALDSQPK